MFRSKQNPQGYDVTCYACPQCGKTVSSGFVHECGFTDTVLPPKPDDGFEGSSFGPIVRPVKTAKIVINTSRARKSALVKAANLRKQTLEEFLLTAAEETAAFRKVK